MNGISAITWTTLCISVAQAQSGSFSTALPFTLGCSDEGPGLLRFRSELGAAVTWQTRLSPLSRMFGDQGVWEPKVPMVLRGGFATVQNNVARA